MATEVRVLVGTAKGAFILSADGARRAFRIEGPHFAGWEVYDVKGSPADPSRLYASQTSSWFGQVVQRSDDGGANWYPVGNGFSYEGDAGTHLYYDGTPRPFSFSRIWHFEPSADDPDAVLAGVEDAAIFSTTDGGATWTELAGLRQSESAPSWQPGAGGMCAHTIVRDPTRPERIYAAISAAGVLRSDDAGRSWQPANVGLRSEHLPDPEAAVGHCVHRIAVHPASPDVIYMQKHFDVMRSDDGAQSWTEVSGNLPSDFGFPIVVHAHEPETVYVVPITSDSLHYPPDAALRVYRSTVGGNEWEPLTSGLPQQHCYVNVLRAAFCADSLDPCGLYVGTTGGQVYGSADGGDTWECLARDLPRVLSVSVQSLT